MGHVIEVEIAQGDFGCLQDLSVLVELGGADEDAADDELMWESVQPKAAWITSWSWAKLSSQGSKSRRQIGGSMSAIVIVALMTSGLWSAGMMPNDARDCRRRQLRRQLQR
jgi:hypothetical protein